MNEITILTRDKYLARKIELCLMDTHSCKIIKEPYEYSGGVLIVDSYSYGGALPVGASRIITIAPEGGELSLPFSTRELNACISGGGCPLEIDVLHSEAILFGKRIRLTELELSLFSELYSAGGELIDRATLIQRVFECVGGERMLNLYIHYLRKKLEAGGEKIILSARGGGYAVNKKFLSGDLVC